MLLTQHVSHPKRSEHPRWTTPRVRRPMLELAEELGMATHMGGYVRRDENPWVRNEDGAGEDSEGEDGEGEDAKGALWTR